MGNGLKLCPYNADRRVPSRLSFRGQGLGTYFNPALLFLVIVWENIFFF